MKLEKDFFCLGYNLSTEKGYEQMMTDFEEIIGLKYLKAVHMNDSKGNYIIFCLITLQPYLYFFLKL